MVSVSLSLAQRVPLVQLAQTSMGKREGIHPLTLHPLLFWHFKYAKENVLDPQQRDDMLRWLLFANGLTSQPSNGTLNRYVFSQVKETKRLQFSGEKSVLSKVFDIKKKRETIC